MKRKNCSNTKILPVGSRSSDEREKKGYGTKLLIAGVGGQGIVFLTNILAEAAMLYNLPVSVSEIHGLSQRGGVVTAGIGFGKYTTGFIGMANVDFLIGLEPLETQRCLPHLHRNSSVIFGNYKIPPYAVNAEIAQYPDVNAFAAYLHARIKEVVFVKDFPNELSSILQNIFLLGAAAQMKEFPFREDVVEEAIKNTVTDYHKEKALAMFHAGRKHLLNYNEKESATKKT